MFYVPDNFDFGIYQFVLKFLYTKFLHFCCIIVIGIYVILPYKITITVLNLKSCITFNDKSEHRRSLDP